MHVSAIARLSHTPAALEMFQVDLVHIHFLWLTLAYSCSRSVLQSYDTGEPRNISRSRFKGSVPPYGPSVVASGISWDNARSSKCLCLRGRALPQEPSESSPGERGSVGPPPCESIE